MMKTGTKNGNMVKKSIKTKISLFIILSVLIVSLVISTAVTITISNNITKSNVANLKEFTEVASQRLSAVLMDFKTATSIVASNPIVCDTAADLESRLEQLTSAAKLLNASNFGITDENGINLQTQTNVSGMDYFQKAKLTKDSFVSSPIVYSTQDGTKSVIMVSAPIIEDGNFVGIVFFGFDGQIINAYVEDTTYGKSGVCTIIDSKGITIGAADYELVLKSYSSIQAAQSSPELQPLADLHTKQMNGEDGYTYMTYGGTKYLAVYQPIENSNGWNIDIYVEYYELMEPVIISLITIFIVVLVSMLMCIVISVRMARSISDPIKQCVNRISKISSGDLSSPVPVLKTNDEIGVLSLSTKELVEGLSDVIQDVTNVLDELSRGNLNVSTDRKYEGDFLPIQNATTKIVSSLNDAMYQISLTSDRVAMSSEQVSNGAQALSQGATEQASSVAQLAATINDISQQVQKSDENAQQASDKARLVGEEAKESNKRMHDMLAAMSEISEDSSEIGKIIKTIGDIAFQTNILALNAAVEAARAGVAGKGFAVVADEVRNLASKSADALKNTTELIEKSLRAVENGSKIADETAQALSSVVGGLGEVTGLIEQISAASNEQAMSITQVSQGVDQISDVVQTNSATAQQSAAASEDLSVLSQSLKNLVGKFRLKASRNDDIFTPASQTAFAPEGNVQSGRLENEGLTN